jgi:hypothetical protein
MVEDLDPSRPVELAVLALKEGAARTRRLGSDQCLTLRTSGLWRVVPGDIATVHARRQWRYAGHPYMSGDITDVRLNRHGLAASSGWMSAKAQRSHALHLE